MRNEKCEIISCLESTVAKKDALIREHQRVRDEKDEHIAKLEVLLQGEKEKHKSEFKDKKRKRLEQATAKEEAKVLLQQEHKQVCDEKDEIILCLTKKLQLENETEPSPSVPPTKPATKPFGSIPNEKEEEKKRVEDELKKQKQLCDEKCGIISYLESTVTKHQNVRDGNVENVTRLLAMLQDEKEKHESKLKEEKEKRKDQAVKMEEEFC